MNIRQLATSTPVRAAAITMAVIAFTLPTIAQTDSRTADQIYQQERAACMAGNTNQSQADCLYEARSALRDRRAGNSDLTPNADNAISSASNDSTTMAQADMASGSTDTSSTTSTTTSGSGEETLAPRADRN